jgi:hypothetical protein
VININVKFEEFDIDKIFNNLKNNLSNIKRFEKDDIKYFTSYFEFVKYFNNIKIIDYHSLVISAYFTYGWMPTILKNFNIHNLSKVLNTLNKVKNNIEINNDEFLDLVQCINNSVIGTSKLLHFINPQKYPIFDRRIKNYFRKNNFGQILSKTYHDKSKEIIQYRIYKNLCLKIITDYRFKEIYNETIFKLGITNTLTKIRVLEYLFFTFGKS